MSICDHFAGSRGCFGAIRRERLIKYGSALARKTVTILHAHASRYNVGDDAIVIAMHRLFSKLYPSIKFRFFDMSRDDIRRPGEPIAGFLPLYEYHRLRYFLRLMRYLFLSNGVLIGGGELICGALEFLGIGLIAKVCGRPVVFSGVGVNLKERSLLEISFTKLVLSLCDKIVVRDREAYFELMRLGVAPNKVVVGADIVFSLSPLPVTTDSSAQRQESPVNMSVGVSLRTLGGPSGEISERGLGLLAEFLDKLVEKCDAEITFFPFLAEDSPYEQDLARKGTLATDRMIMEKCIKMMKVGVRSKIYQGDLDPFTLMTCFSRLTLMFAMRLHASILALNAGVCPIALNYAPKVKRVLSMVGIDENVVDLKDISPAILEAKIGAILKNNILISEEKRTELRKLAMLNVSEAGVLLRDRNPLFPILMLLGIGVYICYILLDRCPSPLVKAVKSILLANRFIGSTNSSGAGKRR